jgi:hypothetical protein
MKYSTSTSTRYRIMEASEKYLASGSVALLYRPSIGEMAFRERSME